MTASQRDAFDVVPAPDRGPATLRARTRLYQQYVEPASGDRMPDAAICSPLGDLSRRMFLEYVTRRCGVMLLG